MMNMCHAGMDKRDPSQSLLSREGIETANPKLLRLAYEKDHAHAMLGREDCKAAHKHSQGLKHWYGSTSPEWQGVWRRRLPVKSRLMSSGHPQLANRTYIDRLVAVSLLPVHGRRPCVDSVRKEELHMLCPTAPCALHA
eukprot:scaffold131653_cov19-Tisochrysis_lutea.AAC.1